MSPPRSTPPTTSSPPASLEWSGTGGGDHPRGKEAPSRHAGGSGSDSPALCTPPVDFAAGRKLLAPLRPYGGHASSAYESGSSFSEDDSEDEEEEDIFSKFDDHEKVRFHR